ncbi:hypothetical protein SAMN04487906_0131 [Zhouia amylolytica]|uniref:Lipoprotein n=2 Tax=Zhouia amylolytica TaxID=376730 RepID=W2UK21_9FLAO|nr:hypothetical protein [Zhouia amylolytica]ETN93786.1 hypothetical protein P278_31960 [Zhouia amylolytica AD3]MCQ0111767.1 hypothetical protein [Zhouia amylolytica]SFS35543.1 hypothetical protein SAMN04487906_0131 [Zhouia amylolytica]
MKKLVLSLMAFSALFFTSCSTSDDDNTGGENVVINPGDFKGELKDGESLTLNPSETYNLTGAFIVRGGATLTIPAGTTIEASGGTSSYIAVAQDGQIFINGTANDPVVMTSAAASPAAGDWGGLVICGRANTNKGGSTGQTATAEVSDLTYGGTVDNDNSGIIKYLRIEYTGATFNGEKEFNGLSLFGVGSGTTIEYVQSFEGGDDGIEFFGGSVNGRYLVSTNSGDDSIDFADGWSGTGEYWYISGGAKAGIEGSNNGDDAAATPTTTATLKNITVVGPGSEGGIYVKEGGGIWTVENFYISDFETGIHVKGAADDAVANGHIDNDEISFTNVIFNNVTTETSYQGANTDFYTVGTGMGAGNGADVPNWANGWTRF